MTHDEKRDYSLDPVLDGSGVVLSGVLRLLSPAAYEKIFEPVRKQLGDAVTLFTIDIRKLTFMNSSGITGISRIVLFARQGNRDLRFIVNEAIPWQKKTITSLQKLYPRLGISTD